MQKYTKQLLKKLFSKYVKYFETFKKCADTAKSFIQLFWLFKFKSPFSTN